MMDPILPAKLSLTALLTSGIICALSAIYVILCIAALVLRGQCDLDPSDVNPPLFLFNTIYRTYFLKEDCDFALDWEQFDLITNELVILTFVIITLIASVLCLGSSIVLIVAVKMKKMTKYFVKAAYVYIGLCAISMAIDVTLAGFFCSDYIEFKNEMEYNSAGTNLNYLLDISRLSAFVMMIISLKGVFPYIINVVLIILLIIYITEYKRDLLGDEHYIHKVGVLNAYESNNRGDNWNLPTGSPASPSDSSSRINNGFTQDGTRHKAHVPHLSVQSGSRSYDSSYDRPYDNADPWRKHQNQIGIGMGARPFSYLEEASRSIPMKPLTSPVAEPSRRRDYDPWEQPPFIPAPDYSPTARRLKSALKPTYM